MAYRDSSSSDAAKSLILKKGDVIGIFDFDSKEHTFSYKALENTNLLSYPMVKLSQLTTLLEENKDLEHFLLFSMVQNVSKLITYYRNLMNQQSSFYQYLLTVSSNYQKLCQLLELPVKILPNKDKIQPFSSQQEEPAFWMESYYRALKAPIMKHNPLFSDAALVTGLLARSTSDIHSIIYYCEDVMEYLQDICRILLSENGLDLFDLYTDLLFRAKSAKKDTKVLEDRIAKMISVLNSTIFIDKSLATNRIQEYERELKRDLSYDMVTEEPIAQIEQKLAHSMELILDYADTMAVTRNEFIKYIELYKKLPDKNGLSRDADTIRRQLTHLFNIIYTEVFQIALYDPSPPIVVKMFLHFGYVDLELAGLQNASYLYTVAKNYQGNPKNGIYTMYEWITAIYKGEKQPSRNELSQDYSTYLQTLRAQGKIDAKTVQKMLDDTTGKVMYELESMFPVVNKITNGHYTTFCPIFIEENVIKGLDSVLVTPYKIKEALNKIVEVDFSAFHRTYLYADNKLNLRETVLIDVRPDFILMPNVGSSGICWQEIEGMQRSTPGRMMISAFHVDNLEQTLIRMVGDFRWELCRRIQGMRWNDVTEHSLTSDYYDYAMFYAKNRALSQDTKEKIKHAMIKAKNNYKNLFIMDYTNWIMFESKGAVKLNKVARQIFAIHCPFRAEVCENLVNNAAFTEPIEMYTLKKKQQLHRLHKVVQKYMAQGKDVPEPLQNHIKLIDQ